MEPPRPRARSRRRGGVERPINARMVRGTALLVALPLLLAAFSVARPQALPPPALPPTFDTETAVGLARDLAARHPDRAPGSPGALGAARWFEEQLGLYGFEVEVDVWRARVPGRGEVELRNLVAVATGRAPQVVLVTAHRDNTGESSGANDNASGTAALVELARAYAVVTSSARRARPQHTLVFASTDGGAYGGIGAERLVGTSPYRGRIVAVVSLDALAGRARPRLELGADVPRTPSSSLVRTADVRLLEQTGDPAGRAGALEQLVDLGFPFALGEQAPFVANGIPAVTITTAPEGAGTQPDESADALAPARFGEAGRAVQSLVGSLDAGLGLTRGTASYLYLGERVVRGWALAVVLVAALLPYLAAVVDLFARTRRRRIPLAPAFRSLRSRLGMWALAGALAALAGLLGFLPRGLARPPAPAQAEWSTAGLAVLAAVGLVAWLVGRERLIPRAAPNAEERLAGYTAALLALGLVGLLVVATNPFALVFLLPSLYAWLWLPQSADARAPARGVLLAVGLAGPALLLVSFAERYGLGADAPLYVLSLFTLGYAPWTTGVIALAWAACGAQLVAVAAGRYAPYPDRRQRPPIGPYRRALRRIARGRETERRLRALEGG